MLLSEWQLLERWRRHDARMGWWERFGTLYAPSWDDTMRRVLRDEFASEFGYYPEPEATPPEMEEPWSATDSASRMERCGSCSSWDVRIFTCENGWRCEACARPDTIVWGCIGCAAVVCVDCIWMSHVPKGTEDATTQAAIARMYGVSQARIQQMEKKALYKLSAVALLKELLTGEPIKQRRLKPCWL